MYFIACGENTNKDVLCCSLLNFSLWDMVSTSGAMGEYASNERNVKLFPYNTAVRRDGMMNEMKRLLCWWVVVVVDKVDVILSMWDRSSLGFQSYRVFPTFCDFIVNDNCIYLSTSMRGEWELLVLRDSFHVKHHEGIVHLGLVAGESSKVLRKCAEVWCHQWIVHVGWCSNI